MLWGSYIQGRISSLLLPGKSIAGEPCETNSLASFRHTDLGSFVVGIVAGLLFLIFVAMAQIESKGH